MRSGTQNVFEGKARTLMKVLLNKGIIFNLQKVQSYTFWIFTKGIFNISDNVKTNFKNIQNLEHFANFENN